MKSVYLCLTVFFVLFGCASTPNFEKDRKLSLENATYISIWTVFESTVTDNEMLTVLNQSIYEKIPLFAWFTEAHFLQDSLYKEFISKIIDFSKLESNSIEKSNDEIQISIIKNGKFKQYIILDYEIQIVEYIKLLDSYFKDKIGIPENMIKKYKNKDI